MKFIRALLIPIILVGLGRPAATTAQDLSAIFKDTTATFVLYDLKRDRYIRYNEKRASERFSPFSTFKVPNSIIGLESGVIKDENFVIAWDRKKYPPDPDWNREPFLHWKRDHSLQTAIKYSVVWYYKELALKVGEPAMKQYVAKLNYGNQDTTGGLDKFWLNSSLRISAEEQVSFLKAFYTGKLDISSRTTGIVKRIILLEQTPRYRLSGKTGGGPLPHGSLGWFVGYLERDDNVYFFATNIEGPNYFAIRDKRIELTRRVLAELGLLDKV
ncbi:MAG TPA: penicillin-binding transpeptidase domain-containing protein [Blastocatellia bacterium]|nr:penicillin-binding transpeptidase domain-containing protein [Blastocatellia bacterium]